MTRRGLQIGILSFNRPDYLEQVLTSLSVQLSPDDRCYLFQDGSWNPWSGEYRAQDSDIWKCVDLFSRIIPSGHVFVSTVNLGIAGNYRRAEEYIYQFINADEALFIEDDLILSPHFLTVTVALLDIAAACPAIGYVSAYGDFWASVHEQAEHEGQLQPMHENWGSALTKASWLKQRPLREIYWSIVANRDYQQRDHNLISAFFREIGLNINQSSQDASRWAACAANGLLRLTTRTCHARYIGKVGIHGDASHFSKFRFADAIWFPRSPQLRRPTEEQLNSWREEQDALMRSGYLHSYAAALKADIKMLSQKELLLEATNARDSGDISRATAAFRLGMTKFPDACDQFGHETFRKELLRMLGHQRAWDEIKELISDEAEWVNHRWREVILGRAYAAAGLTSDADYWWGRALKWNDPEAKSWFYERPSHPCA